MNKNVGKEKDVVLGVIQKYLQNRSVAMIASHGIEIAFPLIGLIKFILGVCL